MSPAAITIRRVETRDAAALARTMGDPEVFPGLLQLPFPTEERWLQRLKENPGPNALDLFLVAEMAGEVVGNAGLHPAGVALRRRHAANLGIAVLPQFQGKGVGRALMNALIDYADNWVHILRLELTVYADNPHAIRLYQACGFEIEGTMRAYAMRNGEFVDTLAMARLHPKPPRRVRGRARGRRRGELRGQARRRRGVGRAQQRVGNDAWPRKSPRPSGLSLAGAQASLLVVAGMSPRPPCA